jgi:CheY-like chemotaxis protein
LAPKSPPILIADDNVELAGLLGTLFAEQDMTPVLAHSAANALTLYKVYRPEVVILDLLLPDMTGHKLLAQLRAQGAQHIFVITGVFKGQGQMERVRAIAPLAGWFEKPFDARVLVEQALKISGKKMLARDAHLKIEIVTADLDIQILDPVELEADGIRAPTVHTGKTEPADFDIEVDVDLDESAMAMLEAVDTASPLPPDLSKRTRTPIARSSSGVMMEVSPTAAQLRAGLRAKLRTGPLRSATVPRLLTAFHISHETGEIAFERAGERKVIFFSEGRPVYARSNQDGDRIGAIAKKMFGLTHEAVEHALSYARATDRMLAEVLIEARLIPESSKLELLREQTRIIIRSLLTWSEGRYVIGFNVPTDVLHVELHDHPAALVVHGIRELFDLEKLRKLVPDRMRPMPSPNAPFELHELPMGDAEAMLLLRSTGARTVKSLLDERSPTLNEHDARAHLYGLLVLGILFSGRATKEVKIS